MSTINRVILIGNLGRNPEIRTTNNGKRYATFSIATSKGKAEERQTTWHNIVVFDEMKADVVQKYVTKGTKVYIEGEIQIRKYVAKDGSEKQSFEIVVPRFGGALQILSPIKDSERGTGPGEDNGGSSDTDEIPY